MAESAICSSSHTVAVPDLCSPRVCYVEGDLFSEFKLQPEKVLEKGMCGQIILAIPFDTKNARRVVKTFCLLKEENRARNKRHFHAEVMFMQSFKHAFIMECLIAGECPKYLAICMYYYPRGTLDRYVGSLSIQVAELCVTQIACALRYMHKHNVVHLDVKLENIFMDNDYNAIIGDFGLAVELFPGHTLLTRSQCGFTQEYVAPERIRPETADRLDPYKLDSFCLGVVLWSLVVEKMPAVNINYYLDTTNRQDMPLGISCWLMNLLEPNPSTRLTVTTLLTIIGRNSAFRYVIDRC